MVPGVHWWEPGSTRAVAQLGSALHWGCRGRRFKSCQPDADWLAQHGCAIRYFRLVRQYSDAQLIDAVGSSRSWRGVLRALGLAGTSAAAMRSVRAHADRLELDYGHFTGQRRWTDQELAAAVRSAASWTHVAEALGLVGGSSVTTIRGHAVRLGLDTDHLSPSRNSPVPGPEMRPQLVHLARAGSLMAAAWFEFCGHRVAWPLEPCRYDLLVWIGGSAQRIQVKTTTVRQGSSWTVWISSTGKARRTYDPDEIDHFFVIDGDINYYLIPVATVGGLTAIQLSAYRDYLVPREAVTQSAAGTDRSAPPPRSPPAAPTATAVGRSARPPSRRAGNPPRSGPPPAS